MFSRFFFVLVAVVVENAAVEVDLGGIEGGGGFVKAKQKQHITGPEKL